MRTAPPMLVRDRNARRGVAAFAALDAAARDVAAVYKLRMIHGGSSASSGRVRRTAQIAIDWAAHFP